MKRREEEIYFKNLNALKKWRFSFYEKYTEAVQQFEEKKDEQVKECVAKDGSIIFSVEYGGKCLRLNSMYAPIDEAKKWASQFDCSNYHVNAVIFGFGNGMFIQELRHQLKQDANLFVCEPMLEIFYHAMCVYDLTDLFGDYRVALFVKNINYEEFEELFKSKVHWTNLETQFYGSHTGYRELFYSEYRDFLKSIERVTLLTRVNKDTQEYFSEKLVLNMLDNLKYLKDARIITDYVGKISRDIPAIIVAAGPSLDKNIDELKRAKGKAFILAVDTAMRHLIKHNIMPDAMVTMDPAKPYEYMNNPKIQNIPLFCILEANPQIMDFHKGVKIWIRGGNFLGGLFEHYGLKFGPYNPGGSVATAAFSVCVALEFKNIILVGQDLAYNGKVTHAGGDISNVINEEQGIKTIEGIDGKPIKSRHDWLIYLRWFEDSIKCIKGRCQVIDATEGGAKIHGSIIMTLREVIERYCHYNIDAMNILKNQSPALDMASYNKIKKEIIGYVDELKIILKESDDAEEKCDRALDLLAGNNRNIELDILQQEIRCSMKKIEESFVYEIVDIYMSRISDKFLAGIFVASGDDEADERNVYMSAKMIFLNLSKSIQDLIPKFENATMRL